MEARFAEEMIGREKRMTNGRCGKGVVGVAPVDGVDLVDVVDGLETEERNGDTANGRNGDGVWALGWRAFKFEDESEPGRGRPGAPWAWRGREHDGLAWFGVV